jgi:hypothetical protein
MRQTTLSVTLEVQPESAGRLASLIDDLRKFEESPNSGYPEQYGRLTSKVPALHFMSISVFPSAEYDPLFVIEANFDGEPGPFFAQARGCPWPRASADAALLQTPFRQYRRDIR